MRTLICILVVFHSSLAFAGDGLLSLVSVGGEDQQMHYWWAESASSFTSFDQSLGEALATTDVSLLRPKTTDNVSRIYRTPELTDANAATLAGVLGARWALVGRLSHLKEPALGPGGQPGVNVVLEARLLERKSDGGFRVRDVVDVEYAAFDSDASRAMAAAEAEVARRVGWIVKRYSSQPVITDEDQPLAGTWLVLHRVDDGRVLETIVRALRTLDSVTEARLAWTDGRRVAVEMHGPDEALSAAQIRAAAAALSSDAETGVDLRPLPDRKSTLVEFEVQVRPESQ